MSGLVAAKCPNCGANVRIDPDREYATCSYCQTSSFIKTPKRDLSEDARRRHAPVIEISASGGVATATWVAAIAVVVAIAGVGVAAFALTRPAPAAPVAPVIAGSSAPATPTEPLAGASPASGVAIASAAAAAALAVTPPPSAVLLAGDAGVKEGSSTISDALDGGADPATLAARATGPAVGGPTGTRPCTFQEGADSYNRQCVATANPDGSVSVRAKGTALNPNSGFEFTLHGGENDVWTAKGTLNAFAQCRGPFLAQAVMTVRNDVKTYELKFKKGCAIVLR